jgi:hypothetical protein
MKSNFFLFNLRVVFIAGFLILGLTCSTKCNAQSIVGRWKCISNTIYYTTEGSTKSGTKVQVNSLAEMGVVIIEFNSGHHFRKTSSVINDPTVNTLEGTWTLSGDQLSLTTDPKYHPIKGHESKTSSIVISGNTIVMTENLPLNKMVSKMETKLQKM